jgi:hypothetical protein
MLPERDQRPWLRLPLRYPCTSVITARLSILAWWYLK